MCILPNFEPQDLEELERSRKRKIKKPMVETVELIVPEHVLENQLSAQRRH